MNSEASPDSEYEKLKNSKFKQQKLPAWRPVPTITSTTLTFLLFGVAFIVIGIVVIIYSNEIEEISEPYHNVDGCDLNKVCEIEFTLKKTMYAPIMVYYQLNNFYQNHRRYVKSKSIDQLKGSILKEADLKSECEPIVTMKDLGRLTTIDGTVLKETDVANPCGLIAKSFFNDGYQVDSKNGTNVKINEEGIAWDADKEMKYGRPVDPAGIDSDYWKKIQWTDVMNEHFMVWMRPAGLPNFRKLWGRIEEDMPAGNYIFKITNKYDVKPFKGEKYIVLSEVNAFGGKNSFLGISYLVVGSICIVLAIAFVIGYKIHNPKKDN
jgi:hypothetical protein